ncbi:preprotein translocase subunit SecY [Aminobacter lissarensis]|uniref:Preprotein translocase subunit SecY n=1 Tax=Aminobacter carboxidus TaxID=376165 RepID=A0A8E1WJ67_9HYPH|nr:hypothetical protein [Aminobacter lissarensis]MBB6469458.1 preprotein translocase subunit SecY [Aminobacter lissarensis]
MRPIGTAWQLPAAVCSALLIVALGSRIPLPGLNSDAVASYLATGGAMAGFSILALGVTPLFAAFVVAEIAQLAIPSLARWQAATAHNTGRMAFIIRALALVFAALQGYGIMRALEAGGLADGGALGFIPVGLACFVGATALIIWLTDRIRLRGLGSGFWLLLVAIPLVAMSAGELSAWVAQARSGRASSMDWLAAGAYLAATLAIVVVADAILSERFGDGDTEPLFLRRILVWPPTMAKIVAGFAIALPVLLAPDGMFDEPLSIAIAGLVLTLVLIPVFVFAYARLVAIGRPSDAGKGGKMPALLAVAGIEIVIVAGAGLLNWMLHPPFHLNGQSLIVLMTVALALRQSFDGSSEMTSKSPREGNHPMS